MKWEQVLERLSNKIKVGLDINTKNSTYREIIEIPPYKCTTKEFNSEEGFKVRIGSTKNIDIPLSMLKVLYTQSYNYNLRTYNTLVFKKHYPEQRENHGCYVHSVGQIFVKAGIATALDNDDYKVV